MRNQPKHLIILFSLIVSQLAFSSPADLSQVYFQSLDHIQQAKENKSNQGLEDFILRLNSDNINPRLRNILLKAFFDATYGRREFDSTAYQVLDRSQLYRFSLSQHILLYLHKQDLLDQPIVVDDWLLERHINDEWEQSFLREDLYTLCNLMPQQKAVLSWVFEKNPQLELQCKSLSHHLNILPPNSEQLRDLVKLAPDVETFASGQYHRKPRMYQFCRVNRDFHCRMLMMDENKQWVRDSQGNLWNLPVLGRSRRELPFNQYGGHTPAGIYTIDGVMPEANKQQVFGKYRRLIMEFIRNSDEEAELKKLIPPSNHNANWWTESTIARDVGRQLFRLHGTLRRNENSGSVYYPFFPTLGCVATRETEYDGVDYHDQRQLLDVFMATQGLEPRFENETRIKGLLYVVEIDDTEGAVELSDLEELGLIN